MKTEMLTYMILDFLGEQRSGSKDYVVLGIQDSKQILFKIGENGERG